MIPNYPSYIKRVDDTVNSIISDIPPDLLSFLKTYFEENIDILTSEKLNLELKLIIDTNAVIESVISFIKKGSSTLHKIIDMPLLKLYAPIKLNEEMENKIPEIAKEKRLDVSLMKKIWYNDIKPKINTIENIDESFSDYGYSIIGQRHSNDSPFVALYFQLSSHGIITRDKDISSQPTIKTWVLSDVSKIITVLKKGVFCFYIQAAVLPRALNVLFQTFFSILKTILELISTIVFFIIKIIKGVITTITQLPSWVQIALGVIFLAAIFNENIRKAIIDVLNNMKESLINSFTTIYEWVKPILNTLVLIIGYALYTLVPIYIAFNDAINQIKQIEMEKAQYIIDN